MRIAAAQARPYWLDPSATTKKVIAWLHNAAAQQVELVDRDSVSVTCRCCRRAS